jgi:hypothetical protein
MFCSVQDLILIISTNELINSVVARSRCNQTYYILLPKFLFSSSLFCIIFFSFNFAAFSWCLRLEIYCRREFLMRSAHTREREKKMKSFLRSFWGISRINFQSSSSLVASSCENNSIEVIAEVLVLILKWSFDEFYQWWWNLKYLNRNFEKYLWMMYKISSK